MFPGPLGHSMAGRALESGTWHCAPVQIRDFATDKHRTVDDTPAGGGAGMVLKADVLAAAIDHATAAHPGLPILAMTPRGKPVTQARVRALSAGRSEEHTSELQSLMRISYAVFCLKNKTNKQN